MHNYIFHLQNIFNNSKRTIETSQLSQRFSHALVHHSMHCLINAPQLDLYASKTDTNPVNNSSIA